MRKLVFDKPDELQKKIDRYFETIAAAEKPPTLSGLALFLGTTRDLLNDYISTARKDNAKGKKAECGELLVMAKAQIECYLEEKLIDNYSKGLEFVLKNGYHGWGDKITVAGEVDVKHEGTVTEIKMTDEELMNRISVLQEKVKEIRKKEGVESGADGS